LLFASLTLTYLTCNPLNQGPTGERLPYYYQAGMSRVCWTPITSNLREGVNIRKGCPSSINTSP
ncbi:hypothetical protein, partial [Vibrio cincinnatiensis]|uniref:hypothetical protein n=1 Tax=Vibrio cincinnatiensis TaxID=675 RepID=UPI001FAB0175